LPPDEIDKQTTKDSGDDECGSRVLDPNLEKIIETAIKDFYLRREKPSLASLHREVQQACHKAGATPPSYKAIQSRVRDFDPREVITRRLGPKQAAHLLSPVKAGLYVKEPLQLLQIGHTLVDISWSSTSLIANRSADLG